MRDIEVIERRREKEGGISGSEGEGGEYLVRFDFKLASINELVRASPMCLSFLFEFQSKTGACHNLVVERINCR